MKTYPLLQSQLGVLLQSMQHPDSTRYNLPNYFFLPLSITKERIADAARMVVQTIPELHTRFIADEQGGMRQWCDISMPIPVVCRKCSEAELQAYINDGFVRPFNLLGSDPLFRVEVIETEKKLCLLFDGHHSIVDGISFVPILGKAFAKVLDGGSIEPQPYGMYQAAEDEVASLDTPLYQRAKEYYACKFAGHEMATLNHGRTGTMGPMGRYTVSVGRSECDDWCLKHGTQVNLLFQAAFSHVISVLTRQEQVAYTTVNHGRTDKRLRNSVGMFVKSAPILVNADQSQNVVDFVKSLRSELMSTVRYGIYPFTRFCSDLNIKPGITFNFLAMADMEEYMIDGVKVNDVQPVRDETDSDLSVDIYLKGKSYEIRVESSLAMNDAETLKMVAKAVKVAVCNMMVHPEATLGEIDIVDGDERSTLISLGDGGQLTLDSRMTCIKAFGQCASRMPDKLAVAAVNGNFTYGELSRRSDILAQRLIACGVRPDDFVAVMLPRVKEYPLAVLAIHKAGAAFVPIDLEYPDKRRQYMLDDARPKVVIDSRFIDDTDFTVDSSTIDMTTPHGLAYMIYTSGSTGQPKGVMLHQAGLWNLVQAFIETTGLKSTDCIAGHRSFSFDAHVNDIFPILSIGGSLHIMPEEIRRDLSAIKRFIENNRITVAGFTTSLSLLLLKTYPDLPLRLMFTGGERLHDVYSDHITIVNCYGPTECTNDTSFYKIEPGVKLDNVPIGRPHANGYYFLVDTHGRLVPRGAIGELCYAGIQVGRGYWQKPELIGRVFCGCPFLPVQDDGTPVPMYHTGDLGRWNADGQMEYIGRRDNMVKLHGYRIEPDEIEACAERFEGIGQAVAVIRPLAGSDTLCLYFTAKDPDSYIDTDKLRRFLNLTLAPYMVPSAYTQIDVLPLTPNGKVDRNRLPEPDLRQEAIEFPTTELERQLYDIVAKQLGFEDFGVNTDLVALGMSSLDAMSLSLAISKQTGLQITVGQLLESPTIRHIAEVATHTQTDTDFTFLHTEQDRYPLTENQLGIYIDWELNRDTTQYNVPVAVCFAQTDAGKLADAIRSVVNAHSYIKTRLAKDGESVVQLRRDNAPVQIPVVALDSEPGRDFFQQRVRPFNLFNDDLYRLEIYTYGGRTWLFKDFHHIVSDGLSDAIFFRDLLAAYQGIPPVAETVTAFDYALYEQHFKETGRYREARDYFDNLIAGTEVASLPLTNTRLEHKSGSISLAITGSEAIRNACRSMGITPNSYFQTVTAQVLHRITRQERLMIATVSSGRSLAFTENIMGMFVRTLPMVSEIATDNAATFRTTAQAIHRQNIESISRDFYPFTEMVERHRLRPEILFAFEEGIYDNIPAVSDPDTDIIIPELDTQKMPVELTVYPDRKGTYTILLNYDMALYSKESMSALASALKVYATNAAIQEIRLCDIELTTNAERQSLVQLGMGEQIEFDHTETLVSLLRKEAAASPDSTAVVYGDRQMTYSQLDSLTDRLARYLASKYNVQPQEAVGVMIGRSELMVVYAIAIIKAGGAYMPLDHGFPAERLQYMCDDASVRLILSEDNLVAQAMPTFQGQVFMSSQLSSLPESQIELPAPDVTDRYVILYTSGSTGRPKGVALEHRNIVNFCHWYIRSTGISASDRMAMHAAYGFDCHMMEMFPALMVGATLYVIPEKMRLEIEEMNTYFEENAITMAFMTTQVGHLFASNVKNRSLRMLCVVGEKLMPLKYPGYRVVNGYGPTEATIITTFYNIDADYDRPNIGRPLDGYQLYVVDPYMRMLPRGIAGELVIGGAGVARGYLHPAEKDAHRFFSFMGGYCYRTGDLVRWADDGNLDFIGRIDNQVKLRGLRIELGEIEACASRFREISHTAVQVIDGQYLCLYYTATSDFDAGALKQHLLESLPPYMVPSKYIRLDHMPLTANGKIDRLQLPEPAMTDGVEGVPPHSEKEGVLLLVAQKVLGRDDIGITDDLFDLGLTSITSIKVIAMANAFGVNVSVNNLMRLRTVERVFAAQTPIGYWFNSYSPDKPVLISPHGIVPVICMTEKFREWQDRFSIYTFEPVEEHAERLSPNHDYEMLVDTYADILDRDIPADAHIFGFVGYSWAGEFGYSLAAKWQQRHGHKANVYLCDTLIVDPDTPPMTEDQVSQSVFQYFLSHMNDFDLSELEQPGNGQFGDFVSMLLMKCADNAGYAGEVLKIATRKFMFGELFRRTKPLPRYDGQVTFFIATQENPMIERNLAVWHELAPTMDVVKIDDNHINFSIRNDNTYIVTERLLGDLDKWKP